MTTRRWSPEEDLPALAAMFEGNGTTGPHSSHFPPLGVICEDGEGILAAMWAYQAIGVGVAFPEWMVTRAGASPWKKLAAVKAVFWRMEMELFAEGYYMMRSSFLDERVARLAVKLFGFHNLGPQVYYLVKNTAPEWPSSLPPSPPPAKS